jgi:hypothetical protein
MKNDHLITSVGQLVAITEDLMRDHTDYILFRGQSNDKPLLPKVARTNPLSDTTHIEMEMLKEFRRRLARERDVAAMDSWDMLIYAQHHGLSTRLLDWTTNPLFALWFACEDFQTVSDSYIFLLKVKDQELLDISDEQDPFAIKKTYVVKPNLNNSRIRAQSGWFTAHRFSKKENQFIAIEKNSSINGEIVKISIPKDKKLDILKTLDKLGVNEESVYPGPEGTAKYINWLHRDDL